MNLKLIQRAGFALLLLITFLLGAIIYHQGKETQKLASALVSRHLPAQEKLSAIEGKLNEAFYIIHRYSKDTHISDRDVMRAIELLETATTGSLAGPAALKGRYLAGNLRASFEDFVRSEGESYRESEEDSGEAERFAAALNKYRLFLVELSRAEREGRSAESLDSLRTISNFLHTVEITFRKYRTRERETIADVVVLVDSVLAATTELQESGWNLESKQMLNRLVDNLSTYRSALVTYYSDQQVDLSETTLETLRQLAGILAEKEAEITPIFAGINGDLRNLIFTEQKFLIRSQKRNMVTFAVIAVLGFIASLVVSISLAKYISARIRHLVRGTHAFSSGHLHYRFPEKNDDLGILGQAFNDMAERISEQRKGLEEKIRLLDQAYSEIRSSRDHMESRIVQRTKDLKDAMEREKKGSRSKTGFLRGLGHELANNLQAISIVMDIFRTSKAGVDQDLLALGEKALGHMERFIGDLRIVAKAEERRLEFSIGPFSPARVVQKVVVECGTMAKENEIIVKGGAGRGEAEVYGDEQYFSQALKSALLKVLSKSGSGSVEIQWCMSAPSKGGVGFCADIIFGETGMDEEELERFFAPFEANENGQDRLAMTGLEIMVSRFIFESMGGEVALFSTPGFRPLLRIEVPFALQSGVKDGSGRAMTDLPLQAPGRSAGPLGCAILLAEDNMVNEKLTRAVLEILGCPVTVVRNGREAVEEYERGNYDLILMDCSMPVMDGYEAAAEIRRREALRTPGDGSGPEVHVHIVALTGNAMVGDRDRCLQAGMNDYISKPFSIDTLREVIRRHSGEHEPAKLVPEETDRLL